MRLLYATFLSFVFISLGLISAQAQTLPKAEYDCNFGNPEAEDRTGESVVYRCRPRAGHTAPIFNVAVLKGTPREVNRAHGYLLAHEAEIGPIKESIDLIDFGLSQQKRAFRPTLRSVISCFSKKLFNSLNPEFQESVAAFEEGYRQRLGSATKYPTAQLRLASVGIELDNILTAVDHKHSAIGSIWAMEKHCPGRLVLKVILNGGLKLLGNDKGFGCTAFAVPEKNWRGTVLSREGLVVGRTLDAELMQSWNRVPTLFVVHEEGEDRDGRPYLSYVATGAAGLIYAGGISGYNTEGITVSLHQMWAADATLSVPKRRRRKAALAPVVQQTILREARSIDDAVRIARRYQAIATWTILIADAKTGEAATIEITKGGVKLVRRAQNQPIGQTNHVYDREQKAYAFFPSYNKYSETHTRMATLEKAFDRLQSRVKRGDAFDVAQAITQLANHDDINGRFQPFGATSVKAYNVMSAVMLPQARKIYMSVGDFAPSPHATFLGFQLDDDLNPVATVGTLRDQSLAGTPGVLRSLEAFVQARLAYEKKNYFEAERRLRGAIALASDESLNGADPAWPERKAGALRVYNYILARLLAMKATRNLHGSKLKREFRKTAYDESRKLFTAVMEDPHLLPYQRALAAYHYGLAELKFRKEARRASRLTRETVPLVNDALKVFISRRKELQSSVEIKGMADNISNTRKILRGLVYRSLKADDIDWIVIR